MTQTNEITTSTTNGAKYSTITKKVAGNTWEFMQVSGTYNYISVCKKTNNPFGGRMGKDFKTFEAAAKHYKSPEMKTALLMAEIEFNANDFSLELNRLAINN
jgi:hypothetical protein